MATGNYELNGMRLAPLWLWQQYLCLFSLFLPSTQQVIKKCSIRLSRFYFILTFEFRSFDLSTPLVFDLPMAFYLPFAYSIVKGIWLALSNKCLRLASLLWVWGETQSDRLTSYMTDPYLLTAEFLQDRSLFVDCWIPIYYEDAWKRDSITYAQERYSNDELPLLV